MESSGDEKPEDDPAHLRCCLAELAAEILRLQDNAGAPTRRTGAFDPEALRRWADVGNGPPGTADDSPATPGRTQDTTPIDSLPSPTSTADGRSEAADLLRTSIQKMQTGDESGDAVHQVADFTSEGDELRAQKGQAEAEAALLSAELVAQRGRHEEEKRQLLKTAKDLRRRNEELENRIMVLQTRGSRDVSAGEESEGENKFGFRVKALAQRFASPHPRGSQHSSRGEDGREAASCASSINTHEEYEVEFGNDHSATPGTDESTKLIAALEAQLHQSEQRSSMLEQRLTIVKESGDAVIQSLNEELADVAEDRARSEAAMIKELSILDSQRRAERNEYEKRIQEWIAHDANRKMEVDEYETRIESLLSTVRMMHQKDDMSLSPAGTNSASWDKGAEEDMLYSELIAYIELLQGKPGKGKKGRGANLVRSINDALDLEFNANPNVADDVISYYRSRPELKQFTLTAELHRMGYELLVADEETGKDAKLVETDEIRAYFESLSGEDEEIDIIVRAANQSLLADPLAILTGEGDGKLVHTGSFHSIVFATDCLFKIDLRREGERRIKVQCELAICVPSGLESTEHLESEGNDERTGATLELARANLVIQFSPSPTSTPSGPLVKYTLVDVKPTIASYEEGSDNARALQAAVTALVRDRQSQIHSVGMPRPKKSVRSRLFSSSFQR
ncbi:hypothetical protein ACHAXT_010360 [Thalassiosira profunda]